MRVLKPAWVSHDGKPIFSIDIHPDGSRFATGGQGDDYGKIVIWNMGPVRDEALEKDAKVPKILCQMDSHTACVNCVKWSHSGKFLASGADDKLVMIWQTSRGAGPSKVFGSSGSVVIVEQWRPVFTMRGHLGDVLDVNWSPQDVWLATCSVDNTIIVWNSLKFPEQVATLKGHTGLVKGVTWDPVGKYVASQSDDHSLRVWRTRDWKEESVITEPFKECGGTTHSLRLNWSPDGHHIVSAHAMNNSGPTAQIIERQGFKASLDFVGHRKAITVVRFNPNLLSKRAGKSEKSSQYTCCAIGSKDRSLSIWLTSLKRPLVVMHDLFENSIVDLSWGQNGLELMSCSIDGTVAFMDFTVTEIGHPLSKDEVSRLLEKMYGRGVSLEMAAKQGSQIIESTAMLNLQEKNKMDAILMTPTKNSNSSMQISMGSDNTPFKPRDKQIETRTADGRRRITPIFLAPQPEVGEVPLPFSTNSNIGFHSSSEKSKIVVEKQDRVTAPGMLSPSSGGSKSLPSPPTFGVKDATPASTPQQQAMTCKLANEMTPEKQVNKTPPLSTPPDGDIIVLDKTPLNEKFEKRPVSLESAEKPIKTSKDKDKDKDSPVLSKEKTNSGLSLKRKYGDDNKKYAKRGRPSKVDQAAREAARAAEANMSVAGDAGLRVPPVATVGHAAVMSPQKAIPSIPTLELPGLSIAKCKSMDIQGRAGSTESLVLEVENDVDLVVAKVHRLSCLKGGQVTWEHVLSSKIVAMCGSKYVVAVACADETISIFSIDGRRLLPFLVTGSPASVLCCSNYHVMLITRKGKLFVWNGQTLKAEVKQESMNDFMSAKDSIDHALVTPSGIPLVTLKNKKSYSFNPDIGCWVLVDYSEDKIQTCSNHHRCVPTKSRPIGPLSNLQKQSRPSDQAFRAFQSKPGSQQTVTLSHLENQIAASHVLKSADEYRFWLETYIRYLSQEGLEVKLREICNELLGPIYQSKSSSSWSRFILGVDKHSILRSVLPSVGSDLRFQRLYTEYKDQLDMMQTS